MQSTSPKTGRSFSDAGILVGILLIIVLRRPELLTAPRFWAEEGQVYFASAFSSTFITGLFSQYFGYYTLVPNLATGLAMFLPLHLAPFATTVVAFLVQFQVCSLVVFTRSSLWTTHLQKGLLCFGVILLSTGDVWLNTINSMYWLAIGTFFILMEECAATGSTISLWYRRLYLLVAGLTGVVSCFMTPVYALKAWHTKEREQIVRTAILAICSVIQLAVLVTAYRTGNGMLGERFTASTFSLQRILVLNIFDPFAAGNWLNWDMILRIDEYFLPLTLSVAGDVPLHFFRVSVMTVEVIMLTFFVLLFMATRSNRDYRYLLFAYTIVTVLSTVSSLRMASSPRYVFAPSCMLLTAMIGSAYAVTNVRWQLRAVQGVLALVLLVSVVTFRAKINRYFSPDISWTSEISHWKTDPAYRPMIWPPGWSVELRSK